MTREQAIAEIRAIGRTCRGPMNPRVQQVVKALLEEGRTEEAKIADARGRKGCGADFNDVVCAGPFDGAVHRYRCPAGCGVEGTYRAPFYELEE